jgi:arginyl-tRNA synthetase
MNITTLKTLLTKEFDFDWQISPKPELGILSSSIAFRKSKEIGKPPIEISTGLSATINEFLKKQNPDFCATTAGPYINIDFTETGLQNYYFQKDDEAFTQSKTDKILLDYFAPNVGKTMHIGNIRSSNIGEALRRILSTQYKSVITNNHLGDWGIQFGFIIWGIQHVKQLKLDFQNIHWENELPLEIVAKLQKIYVAVNTLSDENEQIRKDCQHLTRQLEQDLKNGIESAEIELWNNIVNASVFSYTNSEGYLGVNCGPIDTGYEHISQTVVDSISSYSGVWSANSSHKNGQFDLILGESFYTHFMNEADYWVQKGLAKQEGNAIYFDLEEQGLGRCYVVTSEGYSIYAGRDIVARFLWAGLFETVSNLTCTDNRQSHSFRQVFCIVDLLAKSRIYDKKPFAILSIEQTQKALHILKSSGSLIHVPFGFMTLPDGAMSARKGKGLMFEDLKIQLEKEVEKVLLEKSPKQKKTPLFYEKVQKISVASLKWQDLSRDREQDIVFSVKDTVTFEGNTGVYQLYTLSRISNILRKNETSNKLHPESAILLNEKEIEILKKMFTLPEILQNAAVTLKPHLICTHIFELNSMINSWYTQFSVSLEEDLSRKDALLHFCVRIKKHLFLALTLVGIEPIDEM